MLDQELEADPSKMSSEELAATRTKLLDLSEQLWNLAGNSSNQMINDTNVFQPVRHMVFAIALNAGMGGTLTNFAGGFILHFTSCAFESEIMAMSSLTADQATAGQAVIEQGFAEGFIASLRFASIAGTQFRPVDIFIQRARTDAAKRVAHAILNNSDPAMPEVTILLAQAVANRRFGWGEPLDIQFIGTEGRVVDLAEMRGKVVLVSFWGTQCPSCVAEIPHLKKLYREERDQGFEIVGICVYPDNPEVLESIREFKLPWPNYVDSKGWSNEFAVACGVVVTPTHWLVDRKGLVRETGFHVEDIDGAVELLLREEP